MMDLRSRYEVRDQVWKTAPGVTISGCTISPTEFPARLCVVLVHGFAGDREEGGLFPCMADALASRGAAVVLYDWRGIGASSGDYGATPLPEHARDLCHVVDWVRHRTDGSPPVSAVGFSLGAALVLRSLRLGCQYERVAFLSPAINLSRDMWPRYEALYQRVETEGKVCKPGSSVMLGREILVSLRSNLTSELRQLSSPLYVCHGTDDERIPVSSSRKLFEKQPRVEFEEIPGASHSFRPEAHHRVGVSSRVGEWLHGVR